MKRYLILLALCAGASCLGMNLEEKKELQKGIIKHQGSVNNITFNANEAYIFFSLRNDKKNLVEMYDIKRNEIIETIQDTQGTWSSPALNNSIPWLVAYGHNLHKEHELPKCTLFNIYKGTKITSVASNFFSLNPDFLLKETLFLMPSAKKSDYSFISLKNSEEKKFNFKDDIEECVKSPDKQHLLFSIKNAGSYLHNTETDTIPLLSQYRLTKKAFNPSSSRLAFFERETKKLVVFNLENYEVFKTFYVEEDIKQLFFPNHQTVIFSYDYMTYYIWHTNSSEKPFAQRLNSRNYAFSFEYLKLHERYLHFQLSLLERCDIYDIKDDVLNTIYQKGHGTQLVFNNDDTYAVLCTNKNIATVYRVKDWNLVKTITFENGHLNPFAQFSPCGKFVIVTGIDARELKIYDIEKKRFVLSNSWVPGLNGNWTQFYKDDAIVFASTDTSIMIFNYKNYQKQEIKTKEKITQFAIQDKWLAVSLGVKTELYDFGDITFEESTLPELLEHNKDKKENTTDSSQFYDHNGNLVDIESNGYCLIL